MSAASCAVFAGQEFDVLCLEGNGDAPSECGLDGVASQPLELRKTTIRLSADDHIYHLQAACIAETNAVKCAIS